MVKIGGGAPGIGSIGIGGDDMEESLRKIKELKEKMAMEAARATATSAGDAAPVQAPAPKQVDRAGARGVMSQSAPRVEMPPPPSPQEAAIMQELQQKLEKLGYLPPGTDISSAKGQQQFNQAAQKFIKEHKDDLGGVHDIDDLFALLDRLMAEDNAKHNRAPAWNGQSPAHRPAALPSGGSYSSAPSPNAGALQSQAAQAATHPPPPAGSINAKIAEATQKYMGTSTVAGPDHGNLACAWSVNNILSNAGLGKVGSNPNYVPSVEQALNNGGRGQPIAQQDLKPGDVVIFPGGHHIGIYMGDGKVANNSSSRAAFVNLSSIQQGMHFYRVTN